MGRSSLREVPSSRRRAQEQAGPSPALPALASVSAVRRFPPVLQFLTRTDPYVEQQLQDAGGEAFREGRALEQICGDIYHRAKGLGYDATIGVQEVYSADMPSFPGQTVVSALLMVDLRASQAAPAAPAGVRRVG